ncbi:extracellular solute-binding protein [Pararhizobium sp.]|uniref:extracellular solute-binding protein n=1 Tax=Pararhizobium sp. TaxID=1977563 RepID=UPI0027209384|nr:extracellular solute-binding protein [Pararhizobium sp.]MDO9415546.1 extracellular solute-binding protein [Pararhizobium sp.]
MSPKLTRRQVVIGASAALAAPIFIRNAYAAEEIVILTWENYHEDDWIAEWTAKTGIKVKVVRAGGVDEMFAQTRTGAIEPDILFFDSGSTQRYLNAGLIVPIDTAKIPNISNITSGLKWQAETTIDGKLYGVPYNWGSQPLMFDTDTVTSGTDSWDALWDPKYLGRVSMFDDCYVTFPMIALKVGAKDPFNLTDSEFEACAEALRTLRPNVKTMARGPNDAEATLAAGDAVIGFCQNISIVFNLQNRGKPFNYSFPQQGTPIWFDGAAVTKKGDRSPSYELINEGLSLAWQGRFINQFLQNGILAESSAQDAGLTTDALRKTNIVDQSKPGFWDKLVAYKNPEDIDRRLQIWNDFKAGTL